MLSVDGVVHLSASDLVGHLNCRYLTNLDLAVTKGKLEKPSVWDPVLELLVERGALHEQSYLDHLELNGLPILRIDGIGVDTILPLLGNGHHHLSTSRIPCLDYFR
jgi:uncharacterized protein